jgi:hypothetical protein
VRRWREATRYCSRSSTSSSPWSAPASNPHARRDAGVFLERVSVLGQAVRVGVD